jgi:hypothetical protein
MNEIEFWRVAVAFVAVIGLYAIMHSICQAIDLWTHTREIVKQSRRQRKE